ncbi:hypothetical protein FRIGORI9N_400139 [Frigoribacterium sp. 9N]|nr:hypothetical protein FRIGORI9N_400139 [Frigoribacterium sp. 9N]
MPLFAARNQERRFMEELQRFYRQESVSTRKRQNPPVSLRRVLSFGNQPICVSKASTL